MTNQNREQEALYNTYMLSVILKVVGILVDNRSDNKVIFNINNYSSNFCISLLINGRYISLCYREKIDFVAYSIERKKNAPLNQIF